MKLNQNLKTILAEIILASSIHGIPGIIRTKKVSFKLVWATSFLISTAVCAFMLINSISDYFDYDLVTTTTVKTEIPAIFPKITICNSNPIMTNDGVKYVNKIFNEWNISNKDFYELYKSYDQNSQIYNSMNLYMSMLVIIATSKNENLTFMI